MGLYYCSAQHINLMHAPKRHCWRRYSRYYTIHNIRTGSFIYSPTENKSLWKLTCSYTSQLHTCTLIITSEHATLIYLCYCASLFIHYVIFAVAWGGFLTLTIVMMYSKFSLPFFFLLILTLKIDGTRPFLTS